jgi:thiol-disulfide isomerase/thioredoxin
MAMPARLQLPVEGNLASFGGATQWLNSAPLKTGALRGKVVLVNFWTYTCINWLRSLPYVRAWSEKYREQGLVVIGVHSPEFDFERNLDNVRRAVEEMRVGYPVAVDNNHTVWRAFNNQSWPASYFADAQGNIRYHRFGEGDYERSERVNQQLLAESGARDAGSGLVAIDARGVEAPADWKNLQSPENYLGTGRSENRDRANSVPLKLNHWSPSGDWKLRLDAIVLSRANGRIAYRFHARDVHLVMGPAARGSTVRFRVRLDGQPPADAHGDDVDPQGNGTVTGQRLYQLIRQPGPIADRQFEIEFMDPNVEAFSFTFG